MGPEWVDLVKNVSQASGSHILTLGLGWGGVGVWNFSKALCCQFKGWVFIQTVNQLIPGFLCSYNRGILEPLGIWALRAVAPHE